MFDTGLLLEGDYWDSKLKVSKTDSFPRGDNYTPP